MLWLPLFSSLFLDFAACYAYPLYKSLVLLSSGSLRSLQVANSAKIAVSRRANLPLRLTSRKNIDFTPPDNESVISSVSTRISSHNHKSSYKMTGPNAHLYDDYLQWAMFWMIMMALNFLIHWFRFVPYIYFLKVVVAFFLSHPKIKGGIFLYNRCWRDVRRKATLQKNYIKVRRSVIRIREGLRKSTMRFLEKQEKRRCGVVCAAIRRKLIYLIPPKEE